jgi:hypothetical protein
MGWSGPGSSVDIATVGPSSSVGIPTVGPSSSVGIATVGPSSSVRIATGYGLDGPGIENKSLWGARFFAHV